MDYWTQHGARLRANPKALRAANKLADKWTTRCGREVRLEPDRESFPEAVDRRLREERRPLIRPIVLA